MKGTDEELIALRDKLNRAAQKTTVEGSDLRGRARNVERELARREEKALKEKTGVHVYGSDDYVGMSIGRYQFYFGYEMTMCLKHADCSCDDKEWCFTAMVDGKEVMRIPRSKLGGDTIERTLLHGVAQFLAKYKMGGGE